MAPTATLPALVTVPPGARLFGASRPGSPPLLALGPAGFACTEDLGAGGAFTITLAHPTSNGQRQIKVSYGPAGAAAGDDPACRYFPAANEIANRAHPRSPCPLVLTDSGAPVRLVPTGVADLQVAVVKSSPTAGGGFGALSVIVARIPTATTATSGGGEGVDAQSIECDLAVGRSAITDDQTAICVAAFELFVGQSILGQDEHARQDQIDTAIKDLVSTPPADKPCHGVDGVSLEMDSLRARKDSQTPIQLPGYTVRLPAGISGVVSVSIVLGDVSVCTNEAADTVNGDFSGGTLSLSAKDSHGRMFGPFVYQTQDMAWAETPGSAPMPKNLHLTTQFDFANAEWSIDPSLSAAFKPGTKAKPEKSLQLASADIKAVDFAISLLWRDEPLLEVSVDPELEVSVSVQQDAVENDIEGERRQGVDPETALQNVAGELGGDAVIAAGTAAGASAGDTAITGIGGQSAFATLSAGLAVALANDPAAKQNLPPDDAVDCEITPAEAAAIDAETGAAIDVAPEGPLPGQFQ